MQAQWFSPSIQITFLSVISDFNLLIRTSNILYNALHCDIVLDATQYARIKINLWTVLFQFYGDWSVPKSEPGEHYLSNTDSNIHLFGLEPHQGLESKTKTKLKWLSSESLLVTYGLLFPWLGFSSANIWMIKKPWEWPTSETSLACTVEMLNQVKLLHGLDTIFNYYEVMFLLE